MFSEIDRMGGGSMLEGVLAGIEAGWFQQAIAESAFREQRRYESGDLSKVGVNVFVDRHDEAVETLVIGPEGERAQLESLARVRAERDGSAAQAALDALVAGAGTDANLIPILVDCARSLCTEGEIVSALIGVFGDYRETPRF
jgi:methylmalonyl-CoA mutase, N-terminal domain